MTLMGPGQPGVVHDENARFLGGISGNAGVFSTLNDMIRFAAMLSREGRPLVSVRLMHLASQNYTPGTDENRGTGLSAERTGAYFLWRSVWQRGNRTHWIYGTSLALDRDSGVYVILLTNRVHPQGTISSSPGCVTSFLNAAISEFT